MHRMIVHALGGPSALTWVEEPDPVPRETEVVLEVRAIGCNFADTLICRGEYQLKPPLPFAPGAEVAGIVCDQGAAVSDLRIGDRVLALLPYGGYASRVAIPASRCFRLPEAVAFDRAVALGTVYQTAWFALKHRAPLRAGETLLVHAAAGGVGLAAVQIGRAMGARVIGTAGSEEKLALVREQGAFAALDYRSDGWIERIRELTDGRGVDVVFDPVGGAAFEGSLRCIAWEGRLHVIGFASGTIPSVAMNRVLLKNVSLVGLHLGPYADHDPARVKSSVEDLLTMFVRGEIQPIVSSTYPLAEASAALEALATRKTVGKIVLVP